VFLEGVASRSPHGSAICDKPFATTVVVYHWWRLHLWTVVVCYYSGCVPLAVTACHWIVDVCY
jgi:hypothetical protein